MKKIIKASLAMVAGTGYRQNGRRIFTFIRALGREDNCH